MSTVRLNIAMSLDGFVAGPDQSLENPLGVGGMRLHQWAFELAAWRAPHDMEGGTVTESSAVIERRLAATGATVMGRNMFGGGPGPWGDEPWTGWWGDDPPFHHPVFVLTHHARPPLECGGGTTFTFVTDGVEAALEGARAAAGDRDVAVAGGAEAARRFLAADLVDEMEIDLAPVLLGTGERLFEGLGPGRPALVHTRTIAAPGVTHLFFARA